MVTVEWCEQMGAKRKEQKLSRKKFCESTGFSEISLFFWETGKKTPKMKKHVVSWCKALNVEVPRLPSDDE
jgi:DNA-binding XRE family transcriptional regulator